MDGNIIDKARFSITKSQVINDAYRDTKEELLKSKFSKDFSAHEEEVKRDLMKKYAFDYRQMNLLLEYAKDDEQRKEINDTLNELGIKDEKEKDEVKEEIEEEKKEGKNVNPKESLKEKIMVAAITKRKRELGQKVLSQKEKHIENRSIGFEKDEAIEDIADAKMLETLEKKYKTLSGKGASKNSRIRKEEKKIENASAGLQKGAERRVRQDIRSKEQIEKELQSERRKLNDAIANHTDPKPHRDRVVKLENELVDREKGQKDYEKELREQGGIEKLADSEDLQKNNVVVHNVDFNKDEHDKITQSNVAKEIGKDRIYNERNQELTQDRVEANERKLMSEGDYKTLNSLERNNEQSVNAQAHIDNATISGVEFKKNYSTTQKTREEVGRENRENSREIEKNNEYDPRDDFMNELRDNVNSDVASIVSEKNRNEELEKSKGEDYKKEAEKNKYEAQRIKRAIKNSNKNNSNGYN